MPPVNSEWHRLAVLNPLDIDNDDEEHVEQLSTSFSHINPDDIDNIDELRHGFRLGQKFINYVKIQKEEAFQSLIKLVDENKRLGTFRSADTTTSNYQQYNEELARMRDEAEIYRSKYENSLHEVEQLRSNLGEREKLVQDLKNEKMSVQKINDDLAKRNAEIRNQLTRPDDKDKLGKLREYEQQLNEILTENLQLHDDNEKLKIKSEDLKRELADATRHINELSTEHSRSRILLNQKEQENSSLRNEVNLLKPQVQDDRSDDDDLIMRAVEDKVRQWTEAFRAKDDEIAHLQRVNLDQYNKLQLIPRGSQENDIANLNKALVEKDKQILILRKNLEEALLNLTKQTDVMEKVQNGLMIANDPTTVRSQQYDYGRLKKQIQDYETELTEKGRQLHDITKRFQDICDGKYELRDAVQEIRQLKEQIKLKDRQMEQLSQFASKNELNMNEINDENEELRAKLGMDPRKPMNLEQLKTARLTRTEANQAVVQVLQKEIERLEEERLKLKQNCRQLAKQAGARAADLGLTGDSVWFNDDGIIKSSERTTDDVIRVVQNNYEHQMKQSDDDINQLKKDLFDKTNENKALYVEINGLEQGLKEIDQQLKQKKFQRIPDGDAYSIQCPSLEKMLQLLETQSLAGRYDAALLIKSENDNLRGRNAELRNELHNSRQETMKSNINLKLITEKYEKLQRDAKLLEDAGATPLAFQSLKLPDGLSHSSRDIISCLNEYLVDALAELSAQREMNKALEDGLDKYRRKLNVIKHQTGLLYKDFTDKQNEWNTERDQTNEKKNDLQTEIDKNMVKLQEFDRLLDTLGQDDIEVRRRVSEITRKITVLRVNEKTLGRKILSYQDIEGRLRKDNTKLRTEVVDMEVAVQTRLGYLQRYKDTAAYRIKNLQKQVEESVHQTEMDKINKKYEDVVEKYRDLLEKQNIHIQETEQSGILSEDKRRLQDEVEFLKRQLEIDKEKMHLLEETLENLKNQGLINAGYATAHSVTADLDSTGLSRKITVLEMKELNERQRAEYAQKLYDQQRQHLRQIEDRNIELEKKFSDLTKMNLEMEKTERALRDDLSNAVPKTVNDANQRRIFDLENAEIQYKQEIGRLREISEVAAYQTEAINEMKVLDEKEFQSLRLQLVDLQSQSDEKTEIGKLHRHILSLQISEATYKRKQLQSSNEISKIKAQLFRTEQKLDEKEQSFFFIRQEYTQRIRYLRTALQDYRQKFAGAVPLRLQESFTRTMIELRNGKKQLSIEMKTIADQKFDLETQVASYELKHKLLEELVSTIKDNSRTQKMIEWQQKLEKCKLNELRHIRLNKRYEAENLHLTTLIHQLEVNIVDLEEQNVKFEKEIEERQLLWEHRELEMERKIERLEKQQTDIADAAKRFEEAMGNYPDPSLPVAHQLEQALSIIRDHCQLLMEAKVQNQLVQKKMEENNDKVREMENSIFARDKVIHELRIRLPTTTILDSDKLISDVMTRPDDYSRLTAVRAAQSTIDSLQARILQKEESLKKYQDLLKEAREDLNKQTKHYEEEIQLLNEQLHNKRDIDFLKFKEYVAQGGNPASYRNTPTSHELAQLRALEENVTVQENTIAHLNEKVREARHEAESWKGRLTQKIDQYKHDRESYKISHEKIVNELNREIEKSKSKLNEQEKSIQQFMNDLENRETQPSTKTTNLKTSIKKLKEGFAGKAEQHDVLTRLLAEVRSDLDNIDKRYNKANNDDQQNVSAVVDGKMSQLQEKIDEYEIQIQNLKRELKAQKNLVQQMTDEANDAKARLSRSENKLVKMQQQNDLLNDNVQRRLTQQPQGDDTVESLRRQVRLLEDKLRKTKTAERPYDDSKDDRMRRMTEANEKLIQQVNDLDTHKKELLKFNQQLKDELSKVRLRVEELQKYSTFLKMENENLRNGSSPRSTSSGNIRRIGESGRSTVELEKIIALMKKKIDQIQAENQNLRLDNERHRDHYSSLDDKNRTFFTQAAASTKEIEHMGETNSRMSTQLVQVSFPTENICHQFSSVKVYLEEDYLGEGTLCIAESQILWAKVSGDGLTIDYPSLTMHGIVSHDPRHPEEHLVAIVEKPKEDDEETTTDNQTDNGTQENGSGDTEHESPVEYDAIQTVNYRFIFTDSDQLKTTYQAIAQCQALHRDPSDDMREDDEDGSDIDYGNNDAEEGEEEEETYYGGYGHGHGQGLYQHGHYPNPSGLAGEHNNDNEDDPYLDDEENQSME
ncbi:unnamed protein product [Didymodactylos carnosus]|uniref:Centrosomal protein of 290kDa coiled-coil region domain-containing protein n=1 Tax=Didymodactylos carnosus TaxID=1234261 RepID=A0A813SNX2_9BILA|nr:unnamed protein product [Didymodactylos carnosus]CAF3583304.1 unnamed protein product [Didymodactylos carnosus]